jgi:hypothetical protein
MSNKDLIKKADLTVADLNTNGGLLEPEQADAFLRKLQIQPTILNQSRFVRMNSPQRKINKIGFANRILRPAVSGQALAATDRSKVTTEQITLNTKEVIAEIHLPYDVIEDNIERGNIGQREGGSQGDASGGIKDTIMTLIAERAALDLEELALLGDTGSADTYLALADGYLLKANQHVVDFGGAAIEKDLFKQGLQALPDQYKRNPKALKNFLATNQEIAYRDYLSDRSTGLGDAQIQGISPVFGFGVPVESASLMPSTKGLLTNPQNLIFGVQRQIHIETEKDIRSRTYIIVLTARVDFQIEEVDALVKYDNILVA